LSYGPRTCVLVGGKDNIACATSQVVFQDTHLLRRNDNADKVRPSHFSNPIRAPKLGPASMS